MHAWLPEGPVAKSHVERLQVFEKAYKLIDTPRQVRRQGGTRTKTMRIVCRACNGDWMSVVENTAKPLLTRLLQAERAVLDGDARLLLTQWIALKAMVANANVPDDTVLGAADRRAFRTDRTMPPNVSIWIGLTTGQYWSTRFQRSAVWRPAEH